MIENFGTGISRTIDSYKNYNVKPEFKATENFFFVTLPNVNYHNKESFIDSIPDPINDPIIDPINDPIIDPINDLWLKIMKILKLNPGISTIKLTELIKVKIPSVSRDMVKNELKRNLNNYVEHRGSNKTGGYYLKDRIHK